MMQTITRYILVALSAVMLENLIFSRALGTSTSFLLLSQEKYCWLWNMCNLYYYCNICYSVLCR